MKPNHSFSLKAIKQYIRDNGLNKAKVRLGMKREEMIEALKLLGEWDDTIKPKVKKPVVKKVVVKKPVVNKPGVGEYLMRNKPSGVVDKPAPKPVVKKTPKQTTFDLKNNKVINMNKKTFSKEENMEKSRIRMFILNTIMENFDSKNNELQKLVQSLTKNNNEKIMIKDAELNKDMTKLTYKITDWKDGNSTFYTKSIDIKPKVFVDTIYKPSEKQINDYKKSGKNYPLKQTPLMYGINDKDSYDKIVKKLTEFMGKPLDKKIITNIKSKFKKFSDTKLNPPYTKKDYNNKFNTFNGNGYIEKWYIRDMKDTYIINYSGGLHIETIIKK